MYFINLWLGIVEVINSCSFLELIENIDRLGNAICAGHYKLTVSGRVGYFAMTKGNRYWLILQKIIDNTFYPYHGKGHCLQVFKWEGSKEKREYRRGNDIALALLSVFVFIACLLLMPIVWAWAKVFPYKP